MRRILDDPQAVFRRDPVDRVHVAREAAVMQCEDRLRRRRHRRLDVVGVEIEVGVAEDVAEDRRRSGVEDRVRGGHEVERRKHDFVPGPALDREQRQVQRGRSVSDGDRVPGPGELGECLLESIHAGAHRPPARGHGFARRLHELVVDDGVRQGDPPAGFAHPSSLRCCRKFVKAEI
jgi:hypothetical protein